MPEQAPNIDMSGSGPLVYDKERRAIARANPLVSAGNYLSLVELGMIEAAAQRIAKQWDEKCAEVARLRAALEPFAEEAEIYNEIPGVVRTYDDVELWQRSNYHTKLCVGDLRRARRAVKNGDRT